MGCLDCEGLRFVQALNDIKQENVEQVQGFLQYLMKSFKQQHNKILLSLQYFK